MKHLTLQYKDNPLFVALDVSTWNLEPKKEGKQDESRFVSNMKRGWRFLPLSDL